MYNFCHKVWYVFAHVVTVYLDMLPNITEQHLTASVFTNPAKLAFQCVIPNFVKIRDIHQCFSTPRVTLSRILTSEDGGGVLLEIFRQSFRTSPVVSCCLWWWHQKIGGAVVDLKRKSGRFACIPGDWEIHPKSGSLPEIPGKVAGLMCPPGKYPPVPETWSCIGQGTGHSGCDTCSPLLEVWMACSRFQGSGHCVRANWPPSSSRSIEWLTEHRVTEHWLTESLSD